LCCIGTKIQAKPGPVLVLVAARDFSYEEYQPVHAGLRAAGLQVLVASEDSLTARAINDSSAKPDVLVRDIDPAGYSALVVIGGIGSVVYWTDSLVLRLVKTFADSKDQVLVAIGIGPILLAKAGALNGRKATVYADFRALKLLEQGGARYVSEDVVIDDRIITATGADVAAKTVRAVVKALDPGH